MPNVIASIASSGPRHTWSAVAGLCLIAALVLWVLARNDAAFVLASLGVVAWFLNVRRQIEVENGAGGERPTDEAEGSVGDDAEVNFDDVK